MDTVARRELEILSTLSDGHRVTQRALAQRLGIALGLTNLYVKRLVRKGYVKITTIPPSRVKYLVTPRGFARKTRLTYEYMRYSLRLYREARQTLHDALEPLSRGGVKRIALYGTGEAAEVAYLTLRDLGLEPVAVFDDRDGAVFLGMPTQGIHDIGADLCDRIILASFDDPSRLIAELTRLGVPRERLVLLTGPATTAGRKLAAARSAPSR